MVQQRVVPTYMIYHTERCRLIINMTLLSYGWYDDSERGRWRQLLLAADERDMRRTGTKGGREGEREAGASLSSADCV